MSSEEKELEVDLLKLLVKYIKRWRVFVVSTIFCLIVGGIYLYLKSPTYKITSSILIKEDKKGMQSSLLSQLQNIPLIGAGAGNINIENELAIMTSKTSLLKVIDKLNLYVEYNGGYLTNNEISRSVPAIITMNLDYSKVLEEDVYIYMSSKSNGEIEVEIEYKEDKKSTSITSLPYVLATDYGIIKFDTNPKFMAEYYEKGIKAVISNPMIVYEKYHDNVTVSLASKKTSIMELSVLDTDVERAKAMLTTIISEYNHNTKEENNQTASKRLSFLIKKLSETEKNIEEIDDKIEFYKRKGKITHLESDAKILVSSNYEYQKEFAENKLYINVIEGLKKQISENEYQALPTNIGIKEGITSSEVIEEYNKLLIEREVLIKSSKENHPNRELIEQQIEIAKKNIESSLDITLNTLKTINKEYSKIDNQIDSKIKAAPKFERELYSLIRDKEIQTNIYLTLLRMKEDNAMSIEINEENIQVIDQPDLEGVGPISPKKSIVLLLSVVFAIVFSIIYIHFPSILSDFKERLRQEQD